MHLTILSIIELIGVLLLLIVIFVLIYRIVSILRDRQLCCGRNKLESSSISPLIQNQEDGENDTTREAWHIQKSDLTNVKMRQVGGGNKVGKALWRGLDVLMKEYAFDASTQGVSMDYDLRQLIKLRHPNLVLFVGLLSSTGKSDFNRITFVSEFMNNDSLYQHLHSYDAPITWKSRLETAMSVAKALNYLHQSNPPMVHCNLTSINVLLQKDGDVKVADYGMYNLLKKLNRSQRIAHPIWSAPEIIEGHEPTGKADVYSFGIILYELFTRQVPFDQLTSNPNAISVIQSIVDGKRPPLPSSMPMGYKSLVKACWDSDAKKRPEFTEILERLTELQEQQLQISQSDLEPQRIIIKLEQPMSPETVGTKDLDWVLRRDEIVLGKQFGKGSFGDIYEGEFRGKQVAVKVLRRMNSAGVDNFVREMNVMCALRHPNVVLFLGAVIDRQQPMIVLEHCALGDLFSVVSDKSQALDYKRILHILTGITEGLLYLHKNDPPIIHRDLKSMNILLSSDWTVKISDFGFTDFKESVHSSTVEVGSLAWMAPESLGESFVDERSEVYSWGVIAWELFSREKPYRDMLPHAAAIAVMTEGLRPKIPPYVPQKLKDIIKATWSHEPNDRPAMTEILRSLQQMKIEGLPKLELDASTAKLYEKKAKVYAFSSKDAIIAYKSWGVGESKRGDYVIVGPRDDVYTCDRAIFHSTYAPVPNEPNTYRKTTKTWARKMPDVYLVETLEGMEHGKAGDYLAQNPVEGEQWPIDAKSFEELYQLAPVQALEGEQLLDYEVKAKQKRLDKGVPSPIASVTSPLFLHTSVTPTQSHSERMAMYSSISKRKRSPAQTSQRERKYQ